MTTPNAYLLQENTHHVCDAYFNVEDVLNLGDETWVKVVEIDEKGRINLSRKDALAEIAAKGE